MKKQLVSIVPLKAGIVLGAVYALISLIFVPFVLLGALMGKGNSVLLGIGIAVLAPVLYGVFGFIGGVIAAAVYNLVATWTGGLEFEVRDVAPLPGQGAIGQYP